MEQSREVHEVAYINAQRYNTRRSGFPFDPPKPLGGKAEIYGQSPFLPEGVVFNGVSPALARVRIIFLSMIFAVAVTPGILMAIFLTKWIWIYVAITIALYVWLRWLLPRQVRAIGYAEADSDLLIRSGIMWKSLTVVPYGRLQYVDVTEGPVARKLGLASVQLHTASAETDASIPGLPLEEATRLRASLSRRGEAELAGL